MPTFMPTVNPIDQGPVASTAVPAAPIGDPLSGLMLKRQQEAARMKLLQTLFAQNEFSKGQMIGDHYVPASPLAGIGKVASALGGAYFQKKGMDADAELAQQYLDAQSKQIAGAAGAQTRGEVLPYMGSQSEAVQAVAKAQFERLRPDTTTVNGQVLRSVGDDPAKLVGDYRDKWTVAGKAPDGGLLSTSDTGEIKSVGSPPGPGVSVYANNPENAFDKAIGTKEGERASEMLAMRDGQIDGMYAVGEGKDLLDAGIYTGFAANAKTAGAKIAAQFGAMDPAKAARTEEFIAHIGDVVIPRLKDFGGSDTVEEMKYLQQVTGGNVALEEPTLRRILASVERKLDRKVKQADRVTKQMRERGKGLPTYEEGVQPPVPPSKAQDAPPITRKFTLSSGRTVDLTEEQINELLAGE